MENKFDKNFYNKEYYYGKTGQYKGLAKEGEYNPDMIKRALNIVSVFRPKSLLELGCGTGQIIDILRQSGVDAKGIDISEYATKDKEYLIEGDISEIDYPDAELVISFDILEHLTVEQIDKVLDKCSKFDTMFHSISTGFEDYGNVTWIEDMDKSHISIYSPSWWLKKFYDKYNSKYFINVMTRTDNIYSEFGKYRFTNTNFMLTREAKTILNNL